MKSLITILIALLISLQSFGQMVMKAEGVNPDNVCKANAVYFLMEKKAKSLEPIYSIEMRLNRSIQFVKEHPTFTSKAAIQFAVNCKGEVGGGFHVVTKSGNDQLDAALLEYFMTINQWKPGMIKKKAVDSWYMWRLEIKDGKIDISNI